MLVVDYQIWYRLWAMDWVDECDCPACCACWESYLGTVPVRLSLPFDFSAAERTDQ